MPFIELDNDQPGIRGLMQWRPESGRILAELAQQLLRGDSQLTSAERELIAARVSRGNECDFCEWSHAAAARALLDGDADGIVDSVVAGDGKVDERMRALLDLADLVRERGDRVTQSDIDVARAAGASDQQVHDTVLVASAFCMFNRYVDGLGATTPGDPGAYEPMGRVLATAGYVR